MKYEFLEINNFIVANADAEHFDADLKLYKKLFPESAILRNLQNAMPFQKKQLDERMLLDILNADRICMETIMENRGIIAIKEVPIQIVKPEIVEPTVKASDNLFPNMLMEADINSLKYNAVKALCYGLKLNVPDQRDETLRTALSNYKSKVLVKPDVIDEGQKKS